MMHDGRRALLLDALIDAFPPSLAARLHRLRPGRSGTPTSYVMRRCQGRSPRRSTPSSIHLPGIAGTTAAPWSPAWTSRAPPRRGAAGRCIDEPDRQGFAYGTLPGHPESGIEQFTLTRRYLRALSTPAP